MTFALKTNLIRQSFQHPVWLTHAAVFLFGFSGLFGKFFAFNPVFIVLGRTAFAAITLFAFILFFAKERILPDTLDDAFFFAIQGMLLALHWFCFFYAIQISTVAVGLLTFSTFPLFVTFMEPVFFKEKLVFTDVMMALCILGGTFLVIPSADLSNNITKGGFVGIAAGFTFALLTLVNRRNARRLTPVCVALHQNFFAAVCLLPAFVLIKSDLPQFSDLPMLAVLGVLCTALAHTLFIKSLIGIKAKTASVITGLEPVWGILLAFLILGEIPAGRTMAGGALIILTSIAAGLRPAS